MGEVAFEKKEVAASCAGNAITVWSGTVGASALGEVGKPAEKVAREACGFFAGEMESGASVDSHLADQLLIYAAIAEGKTGYSVPKITPHLETNAEIVRMMTGRNISIGGKTVTVE